MINVVQYQVCAFNYSRPDIIRRNMYFHQLATRNAVQGS
jgi:hypothetical protein